MTDGVDTGSGVGKELAHARAGLRLSTAEVAQQLKFSVRQIEALEQDRFENLPAGTFARGMVRAYARLLKLDAEPLVARMAARVAVPDNAAAVASVRRPIPITDSARRTNMIYGALSVTILAVIAAVVFEWQRERSDASRLSFVAAAAPVEPQRAAEAVASPVAPPNPSPLAAVASVPSTAPVQPTETHPAPVRSAASRPEFHAGNGASDELRRIVMKFDRESWVQIRNRDGKILFSQLNAAGSERTIEGRAPFDLIVGNAQYVRMSYDDHPVDLTPYVKVEVARFTLD